MFLIHLDVDRPHAEELAGTSTSEQLEVDHGPDLATQLRQSPKKKRGSPPPLVVPEPGKPLPGAEREATSRKGVQLRSPFFLFQPKANL